MMRIPKRGRTSLLAATALVAAAALAGCGGGGGNSNSKTVTVWSSVDQPVQDGLEKVLKEKVKADGITIKWQKVNNINQLIMQKIQANDTPDIAFIPQPGVVADIVKRGKGVPLDNVLDMSSLKSDMIPGTLDSGTVNGKLYGLLISANVKSLVYYPKKAFEAAGYTPPKTLDELQQLTDKIKADGKTPWCMGIESDTATGWPATDWIEDLVMREAGPDGYNKWVKHDIKFDSPEVKAAADTMSKLLFTDGNVLGGRKSISSNNFGTAGNPMFDAKPGCYMYKQGSFITDFFPDAVKKDIDNQVGVFGFPPKDASGDNPVLGGGDMGVLFNDSANSKKVMKYLSDSDIGNEAAGSSTFISPHKSFDASKYTNQTKAAAAKVGTDASVLLFDGSDQMPGEVGAGTFWKDMTAWISGQESLDEALKNIDASWPAS
jgi:alpha-glucoside transport system substrate-binding protein